MALIAITYAFGAIEVCRGSSVIRTNYCMYVHMHVMYIDVFFTMSSWRVCQDGICAGRFFF